MRTETDALLSLQRLVAAALPDFVEVRRTLEGGEDVERPFAVVSSDDAWGTDDLLADPEVTLPVTIYAYVKGTRRADAMRAAEDVREQLWQVLAVGDRPRLVEMWDYTGKPAVQRVTLTGATAGEWTLALDDEETDPLPVRPQTLDVRLALEALPSVGAGNVLVFARRLGGPWDVRFDGDLRGLPMPELVADVADLTGPDPAAAIEVISEGSPDPWRGPRDFMRVQQPTFGGVPDPTDPRLRTATISLRLTWGRLGHVRSPEMMVRTITARRL